VDCGKLRAPTDTEVVCVTNPKLEAARDQPVKVFVPGKGYAIGREYYSYIDRWSATTTWGYRDPPILGDSVHIPEKDVILYDYDSPRLNLVVVMGTLTFDDTADRALNASYIMIKGWPLNSCRYTAWDWHARYGGGQFCDLGACSMLGGAGAGDTSLEECIKDPANVIGCKGEYGLDYKCGEQGLLQVGTPEVPFKHRAVITLHGSRRSFEIPVYGSKVIAVRYGLLDLHGAPRQESWTRLAADAKRGDRQIVLQARTGWRPGDTIVLAPTGFSQAEDETATVEAVEDGGRVLRLSRELDHDHDCPMASLPTKEGFDLAKVAGEVGLLSRNVVVQGDDDSYPQQFGAHIFAHTPETETGFSGRPNRHTVRLSNVEVRQAGQGFFLGRYPIHQHVAGNVSASYYFNMSIHDTYNRAFAVHGVHGLRIHHNLAYNTRGHTYFIEDGIETDNVFLHNLAVKVRPVHSLLEVDATPAAFWMTNPGNTWVDNAAAGGSHDGFWIHTLNHVDGLMYTTEFCPQFTPLQKWRGNVAHSNGRTGLKIEFYHPRKNGYTACDLYGEPESAVFEDGVFWRNAAPHVWTGPTETFEPFQANDHCHFKGFITAEGGAVHYESWEHGPGYNLYFSSDNYYRRFIIYYFLLNISNAFLFLCDYSY
jgi:hypothetical protein